MLGGRHSRPALARPRSNAGFMGPFSASSTCDHNQQGERQHEGIAFHPPLRRWEADHAALRFGPSRGPFNATMPALQRWPGPSQVAVQGRQRALRSENRETAAAPFAILHSWIWTTTPVTGR